MKVALWTVQVILAAAFLFAGVLHGFRQEEAKAQLGWPTAVSPALLTFIGIVEIAGAIGLVLPALTRFLPWLTPLAALGLVAMMLLAILFHTSRGEYLSVLFNVVLLALAAFVAYGRWVLVPS